MSLEPQPRPNAVLDFHPDAVESDGSRLMGRHAAGEAFLKGFVRHSGVDAFYGRCLGRPHFEEFERRVAAVDTENRPRHWIAPAQTARIAEVGCLSLPTPTLAEAAWRRRAIGARAYSVCGVCHTLATERVMDGLGALLTSPVQPWDAVICTSTAVRATVRRVLGNWAEFLNARTGGQVRANVQLPIIPLGVDCDAFAPGETADKARAELRQRHGIGEDDIAVLFVGRLSFHAKAHPVAMYLALERAAQRTGRTLHLIQAGWFASEAIEREFREGAQAFCPSVKTVFLDGRDAEVRAGVWFAADIFCSLSDNVQETFGLAPLEAMAAGLPVVVSDWDGYRDVVRHGVDGFTVPTWMPPPGAGAGLELPISADLSAAQREHAYNVYCGFASQATAVDVDTSAQALAVLIGSPEQRRGMGEAGRKRAREGFDWRVVVAAYQALWQDLADLRHNTPESAPLTRGRPANPLRDDPFSLFAAYPTPSPGSRFAVAPVEPARTDPLPELRAHVMNTFAAPALPPPDAVDALLARLRDKGPVGLGGFVAEVPAAERPRTLRAIGWLGKMGLARVLAAPPDDPEDRATDAASVADRMATAERRWRKRLERDPGDVVALKGMAGLSNARGNAGAVVRYLVEAVRRDPDDAELHLGIGQAHAGLQAWDAAVRAYRNAVRLNPGSVPARAGLANALAAQGQSAAAREELVRAVRLAPENADLWLRLGALLRRQGEADAALECLERSREIGGDEAGLLIETGYAHKSRGDAKAAGRAFARLLELRPADIVGLSASASLDAAAKARRRRTASRGKRVAVHLNRGFQYAILRPLFDALTSRHQTLMTGDYRDLVEFDPEVVVVADSQSSNLRAGLPDATFVYVRHGLISKRHIQVAAGAADYTCVSSESVRDTLVEAGIPAERIWITGFIQMDPLFRGDRAKLPFKLARGKRSVLYAPTYNPQLSSAPMLGRRIVELIRGTRDDISLIIKPHPQICAFQHEWMAWWRALAEADPDVHLVDDADADLVPYLAAADLLISDASSATFQFLALDRPIVLVTNPNRFRDSAHFDPEGIEWRWRDMGQEVEKVEELAAAVARGLDDPRAEAERRAHYRKLLFGDLTDGRAVKRVVERIDGLGS